ncbi:hypothetical protein FGKAn22_03830 [Ferrigenium kumadai]|uniref:Uncharacterized protein n=1 Tax=Ferrigenium kumadai TaxID=1682490 RepID=A0AAN1VYZ8_9PROT|nr:hypothetical protein [Ferrigenium kumadai]BBI98690.1 hypothetical protein FGKAn22_03830 [Ferrigenium kumadai]
MGRLSARSNPTGLKEVDRSRVGISVSEVGGKRSFTLDRLDLKDTGLSDSLSVVIVARAGNTNVRHEMGSVAEIGNESRSIDGLDRSQPLRFRVLMHEKDSPKLVASIENLRARDDSQSESLLPMEPADLGERLWKLAISEDGPVLQFNSRVFPSAAGAENYIPFGAMVLPEALRQVMEKIADEPGCLEDEGDPWSVWGVWLSSIGAGLPPADDDEAKAVWCNQVVDRFCEKFSFASRLQAELLKGAGND